MSFCLFFFFRYWDGELWKGEVSFEKKACCICCWNWKTGIEEFYSYKILEDMTLMCTHVRDHLYILKNSPPLTWKYRIMKCFAFCWETNTIIISIYCIIHDSHARKHSLKPNTHMILLINKDKHSRYYVYIWSYCVPLTPCFCVEIQHVCLCLFIFQYLTNAIVSDLALSCVVFAENEMLPMILRAWAWSARGDAMIAVKFSRSFAVIYCLGETPTKFTSNSK